MIVFNFVSEIIVAEVLQPFFVVSCEVTRDIVLATTVPAAEVFVLLSAV